MIKVTADDGFLPTWDKTLTSFWMLSNSSSLLIVFQRESRRLPKYSWRRTVPAKSRERDAIQLSMGLKTESPAAFTP